MTASGADAIYARHQRDISRYASRMSGRADVADGGCQDVFLRSTTRGTQRCAVIVSEGPCQDLRDDGLTGRQSPRFV